MVFYSLHKEIFVLSIKVKPNSKATVIKTFDEDYLYMDVAAVPEKNKANKEVIEYLSKLFSTPKCNVSISKGLTSVYKSVEILKCMTDEEIMNVLKNECVIQT